MALHLHDQDLWEELRHYLDALAGFNWTLYVTLTEGTGTLGQRRWLQRQIRLLCPQVRIWTVPNRGTDNAAFLAFLERVEMEGAKYDAILKLHTKKSLHMGAERGARWRKELLDPLLGDRDCVCRCLSRLQTPGVGMVGARRWVSTHQGHNARLVAEYASRLNLRHPYAPFVGGTMFWMDAAIPRRYFDRDTLRAWQQELEEGYFIDAENGTRSHALERLWGSIVADSGNVLTGV